MPKEPRFIAARLRIARKIAGLSLEDLSRRIDGRVTRQALSKYEQGKMSPSPRVLSELEEVLDLRPRYSETPWGASVAERSNEYRDFANGLSAAAENQGDASRRPDDNICPSSDFSNEPDFGMNDLVCESKVMMPRRSEDRSSEDRASRPMNFICRMEVPRERDLINMRRSEPGPLFRRDSSAPRSPRAPLGPGSPLGPGAPGAPLPPPDRLPLFEPLRPGSTAYLEFRTIAPLPKKKEEALKQLALEYLARYADLERLLGRVIPFRNPISGVDSRTMDGIEKAAVTVRRNWDLGLAPIGNFLEVLESHGIKVYEIRGMEGTRDFDGLAARSAGGYVIALNMDRPADRIRFTAAHELAHVLCDFDGAEDKERLCHVFAGAMLLPRTALEHELVHRRQKITLWELGAIKEKYGISLQAIMYRASELGLITPRHLRDFMETIRANDWSVTEPVTYRGKEESARFKRLLNYAVAEKIIAMDRAAVFAGMSESKLRKEFGTMM